MEVKKIRSLFLFNTDNIVKKILEATTQVYGFNQRLPMIQPKNQFPYSRPHQNEDSTIDTFFSSVRDHYGTTDF